MSFVIIIQTNRISKYLLSVYYDMRILGHIKFAVKFMIKDYTIIMIISLYYFQYNVKYFIIETLPNHKYFIYFPLREI